MNSTELVALVTTKIQELVNKGLAKTATLTQKTIGAYNPNTGTYATTPTQKTVYLIEFQTFKTLKELDLLFPEFNAEHEKIVYIAANGNEIQKRDTLTINSVDYYFSREPKEVTLNSKALYVAAITNRQTNNG